MNTHDTGCKALKPIKGVLFDLDGTLLDTARDLGEALNQVLSKHGLPTCPYSQYRTFASHGSLGLLKLGFGERINEFDLDALREEFLSFYHENICAETDYFDGVEHLLAYLDRSHIPWGIVTNKPGALTAQLLPHFDAMQTSKINVAGDTLAVRKPDPAPLLLAATELGVAPEHILYVGDAERDIQAANAANMTSVLAYYGYIDETDTPEQWNADLAIHAADDLIPLLD